MDSAQERVHDASLPFERILTLTRSSCAEPSDVTVVYEWAIQPTTILPLVANKNVIYIPSAGLEKNKVYTVRVTVTSVVTKGSSTTFFTIRTLPAVIKARIVGPNLRQSRVGTSVVLQGLCSSEGKIIPILRWENADQDGNVVSPVEARTVSVTLFCDVTTTATADIQFVSSRIVLIDIKGPSGKVANTGRIVLTATTNVVMDVNQTWYWTCLLLGVPCKLQDTAFPVGVNAPDLVIAAGSLNASSVYTFNVRLEGKNASLDYMNASLDYMIETHAVPSNGFLDVGETDTDGYVTVTTSEWVSPGRLEYKFSVTVEDGALIPLSDWTEVPSVRKVLPSYFVVPDTIVVFTLQVRDKDYGTENELRVAKFFFRRSVANVSLGIDTSKAKSVFDMLSLLMSTQRCPDDVPKAVARTSELAAKTEAEASLQQRVLLFLSGCGLQPSTSTQRAHPSVPIITVTLGIDVSAFRIDAFRADIARAASVSLDVVSVLETSPGSLMVRFQLLTDNATASDAFVTRANSDVSLRRNMSITGNVTKQSPPRSVSSMILSQLQDSTTDVAGAARVVSGEEAERVLTTVSEIIIKTGTTTLAEEAVIAKQSIALVNSLGPGGISIAVSGESKKVGTDAMTLVCSRHVGHSDGRKSFMPPAVGLSFTDPAALHGKAVVNCGALWQKNPLSGAAWKSNVTSKLVSITTRVQETDADGGVRWEESPRTNFLITIPISAQRNATAAECMFFNFSTSRFDRSGCNVSKVVQGQYVVCNCTHLTDFGVVELDPPKPTINKIDWGNFEDIKLGAAAVLVNLSIAFGVLFFVVRAKHQKDVKRMARIEANHREYTLRIFSREVPTFKTTYPYTSLTACAQTVLCCAKQFGHHDRNPNSRKAWLQTFRRWHFWLGPFSVDPFNGFTRDQRVLEVAVMTMMAMFFTALFWNSNTTDGTKIVINIVLIVVCTEASCIVLDQLLYFFFVKISTASAYAHLSNYKAIFEEKAISKGLKHTDPMEGKRQNNGLM